MQEPACGAALLGGCECFAKHVAGPSHLERAAGPSHRPFQAVPSLMQDVRSLVVATAANAGRDALNLTWDWLGANFDAVLTKLGGA